MRAKAAAVVAVAACTVVPAAKGDNYGGVTAAQERRMVRLIHREFGHGWLGRTMVKCARRESGLNPRAANYRDTRGGSFGLLQLNGAHGPGGYATAAWIRRMWNPVANLRAAHALYRAAARLYGNGLQPWGGSCR